MHPHERVLMNASAKDLATYIPIGLPSSLVLGRIATPWSAVDLSAAEGSPPSSIRLSWHLQPLQPAPTTRGRRPTGGMRTGSPRRSSPGCAPGLDPDGEIRELRALLSRVSRGGGRAAARRGFRS